MVLLLKFWYNDPIGIMEVVMILCGLIVIFFVLEKLFPKMFILEKENLVKNNYLLLNPGRSYVPETEEYNKRFMGH